MKKILLLGILMLSTSLSYAQRSASNLKLSTLVRDSRGLIAKVNQEIQPGKYSSRQFEVNKGYVLIPGDKYTYRLTFHFEQDSSMNMLPVKSNTKLSVEKVEDGGNGFGFDSSLYLTARSDMKPIGNGRYEFVSIHLQILGSKSDSIDKLTLGDIEKVFQGMISFQADR